MGKKVCSFNHIYLSAIRSLQEAVQLLHCSVYHMPPSSPHKNTKGTSLQLGTKDQTPDCYSNQNADICKVHTYHHTVSWVACCTAFFGLVHCFEFTSSNNSAYDPTVHLSFSNVASCGQQNLPTFIRLTIKQSIKNRLLQTWQLCTPRENELQCMFC